MGKGRRRTALFAALTMLALSGCGPEVDHSVPPERPDCPERTTVDLGHPTVVGASVAEFATEGGEVHLEATGVDQGGWFDASVTTVYVGEATRPAEFDGRGHLAGPFAAEVRVVDREFATVTLPAGRYWVTSSDGGDLKVTSCQPGGVTPAS